MRARTRLLLPAVALALGLTGLMSACHSRDGAQDTLPGSDATVVVGGHPMHYQLYGHGTPLLLLHGGGNTIAGSFSHQLAYFAAEHLIIAPEQVGQGKTPDTDQEWSYVAMAEQTVALLDQLKIPQVDVVGWSDGGIVGLLIASRYPERVRHLVVSGANTIPGATALTPDAMAGDASYDPSTDRDGRAAYTRTSADPPEHFPVFARKLHKLWDTQPLAGELGAEQLARIRAPTLVMAGDHDMINLEHTIGIYRAIPGARLMIVPGTGHDTLVSRPDWLNPIIAEFFDRTPGASEGQR
ncbi:MAG: alpha/beta hydrolase [Steroidobacteraceae bacterium]